VYGHAARSGGLPEGLEMLIRSRYGNGARGRSRPIPGVVPGVGKGEVLFTDEARRRGILFTGDALAHSGRFLVTSEVDAALAGLEAAPADRAKIEVVPDDPAGAASALWFELTGRRPPSRVKVTHQPGPVVYELQATQSFDTRHRGIARYAMELALAIEQVHPDRVGAYAVNPDLPLPDHAERLAATGKLVYSDEVDWSRVGLFHSASLLEMMAPLDRVLPPGAPAAGVPVVVSFYDLIPYLFPDHYLEDPGWRRRYRARLPHLRRAAAVLSLSDATRADAVEHLGLDPGRVFVVGSGTGPQFVPPESRGAAAAEAAAAVPGLRVPFVFYVGSYERRKNLEPLLEAWSLLPAAVRGRWQLAVCCPLQPLQLHHLRYRARQMGIGASEVCFTGFVPDEVLLLLHQGTDLFVFPSLYEGYGLPVAEALACGAAVLAADSSSLPEILGPEALFDPSDPAAMAAAIERGLTDGELRGRLLARAGRPPSTWVDVAEATVAVWDRVLAGEVTALTNRMATPAGRARRVALAAPLPPDGGPWGEWSYRLAEGLSTSPDTEVHLFADRPAGTERRARRLEGPPGVMVHPLGALSAVEELEGDFDAVVYLLADDEFHTGSLAALRRRAGSGSRSIVVAHDVHLAGLYGHAARSGGLPEGLEGLIRSVYGEGVAPGVGEGDVLPADEARRRGVLLTRDALAHAGRFLVTSETDAVVARLEAAPADRAKIDRIDSDPAGAARALYSELVERVPVKV
ncbi:MAG: glycosyltransferase family 4 protein, partial [Acidimicrobiia bacterium]